ncbi:MAG TPA: autotransporter domain-containing protein [Alphaproteobacteria bacterium]|nr:autotransporter domain-containing protein [Alphaproteobacteria bacterium]
MLRVLLATTALSVAAAAVAPAMAQVPSNFYFFGDSLTDDGNIPGLTGGAATIPAPYFNNRFSNGPTYAELLPGLLGLSVNPANNRAVGGAQSGRLHNGLGGGLPANYDVNGATLLSTLSLPSASTLDATNGNPLPGTLTQIGTYTATQQSDPNAAYVVWAGANDYFALTNVIAANPGLTATQQQTLATNQITQAITNISLGVAALAQDGARRIYVPNLPDLGLTPASIGTAGQSSASAITANHNEALRSQMAALEQQLGVQIEIVDIASLFQVATSNPSAFGFTNVTQSCLAVSACVGGGAAAQNGFLFWDTVHPTATGHQAIANFFASSIIGPQTVAVQSRMAGVSAFGMASNLGQRLTALRGGAGGLSMAGNLFGGQPQLADSSGAGPSALGVDVAQAGAANMRAADKPLAAFVTGTYYDGDRDTRGNEIGFDYDNTVLTAGVDYRVGDQAVVGAALGYGFGDATLNGNMGDLDQDSWIGAVYASFFDEAWYVDVTAHLSFDQYDVNRRAGGSSARAETDGSTFGGSVGGGYVFRAGGLSFGPTVGVRLTETQIDAYTESSANAGFALTVEEQDVSSLIGSLGLQARYDADLGGTVVSPNIRAALEHEFDDDPRTINTRLAGASAITGSTTTNEPDRNVVRVGAGVAVQLGGALSGLIDYETVLGREDGSDHAITGKLKYAF